MKIATTIEQSERLLKCGVNIDTADMHYERKLFIIGEKPKEILSFGFEPNYMGMTGYSPAWSLSALIYELDKFCNKMFKKKVVIEITKQSGGDWALNIYTSRGLVTGLNDNDFFEACLRMIERIYEKEKWKDIE